MWDIMNPGSGPTNYGDVPIWLNEAQLNFGSINPNNFEIVTKNGKLQLTGQVQEFIVQTPEPGGVGAIALWSLGSCGSTEPSPRDQLTFSPSVRKRPLA